MFVELVVGTSGRVEEKEWNSEREDRTRTSNNGKYSSLYRNRSCVGHPSLQHSDGGDYSHCGDHSTLTEKISADTRFQLIFEL